MVLYVIESECRVGHPNHRVWYRYRSLVNGATGSWFTTKAEAEAQAAEHVEIMNTIYPALDE